MWLGPTAAITPLHKDSTDNFAMHMFGQKRWTVFPVRDIPLLEMERFESDPSKEFAVSRIDLREPSERARLLKNGAVAVEFLVQGGETLYLPAGWGHFVENTEPSFMVNYWMKREQKPGVLH